MEKDLIVTKYSKLSDLHPIGQGGYGLVFKANHKDWGPVVFKKSSCDFIDGYNLKLLMKEAEIQATLLHPNIVRFLGMIQEPGTSIERGNYGLVLEFVIGGEMTHFLENHKFKWGRKLPLIRDVALAMIYLHSRTPPIIHGDLKIQNVLISGDCKAKVCDFGFSHWRDYSQSHSKDLVRAGTFSHIPPENWKSSTLRKVEQFDVYGFGIFLYQVMTGEQPFGTDSSNPGLVSVWVIGGQRPYDSNCTRESSLIPEDVSQTSVELMKECWSQEPQGRPNFQSNFSK